jgi:hypothetical protein
MPAHSAPFSIWSYCEPATLRPRLAAAGCEILREPEAAEAQVHEVTPTGLAVMFLPRYELRVARGSEESEEAARARVYDLVSRCEAEQDEREEVKAARAVDTELSKVLRHAIKVMWIIRRPNRADEAFVTLELRRPSPREKRLVPDGANHPLPIAVEQVNESPDRHVRYHVTARPG